MYSIIEDLYNGNLETFDKEIKETDEYRSLMTELWDNEDSLNKFFKENKINDLGKAFEKVCSLNYKIETIQKSQRFAEGFRFGVMLMAEVFHLLQSRK